MEGDFGAVAAVCEQRAKAAGPLARKSIPASGPLCKKRKKVCPKPLKCIVRQEVFDDDGTIAFQHLYDIACASCVIICYSAQLGHRGPLPSKRRLIRRLDCDACGNVPGALDFIRCGSANHRQIPENGPSIRFSEIKMLLQRPSVHTPEEPGILAMM